MSDFLSATIDSMSRAISRLIDGASERRSAFSLSQCPQETILAFADLSIFHLYTTWDAMTVEPGSTVLTRVAV